MNRYVCHDMNAQLVRKKCPTFLVIMEMEIKSTVRYHFILTMTKRMKTSTAGKDMEKLELSYIVSRNVKGTTFWKKVWWFLIVLVIYTCTYTYTDTYAYTYISHHFYCYIYTQRCENICPQKDL